MNEQTPPKILNPTIAASLAKLREQSAVSAPAEIEAPAKSLAEVAEELRVSAQSQTYTRSGASGMTSSTEDRALQLLGNGVPAESVAAALGVTASRISQLLADPVFSEQVTTLRFESLQSHNKRDATYDSLEDKLLSKMDRSIGLLLKPMDIMKALQVVNTAKRRGQSAPDQVVNQQNVVSIVMPTIIVQKFATNINNQVTKAGDQELLTLSSGDLLKRAEDSMEQDAEENKNAHAPLEALPVAL